MSLLVISEILGLFVNPMSTYDKYSLPNRDNLPQPIQMHVSKRGKTFSQFFAAFPETKSNFQDFEQKRLSKLMYFQN